MGFWNFTTYNNKILEWFYWKNNNFLSYQGIPANIDPKLLENYLESFKNFGSISVIRSKDCSGYKWRLKWVNGGDKIDLQIVIL